MEDIECNSGNGCGCAVIILAATLFLFFATGEMERFTIHCIMAFKGDYSRIYTDWNNGK